MKSVFGLHNSQLFNVFLYATSPPDGSPHRQHYERQTAFHFLDVSLWSNSTIVEKIVQDQIHIRLCFSLSVAIPLTRIQLSIWEDIQKGLEMRSLRRVHVQCKFH